jgi:hypothetical protein
VALRRWLNSVVALKVLAVYGLAVTSLVTIAVWQNPRDRAIILMAWGVILLWIVGVGLLSLRFRNRVRDFVQRVRLSWPVKFVLFTTIMALIEEAVTTSMTNMAPLFGVRMGEAYITASANYLDVVLCHSVIVFVPTYIAWALLLKYYDFRPVTVMFLYGINGTLAEAFTFGPQHILEIGFWVYVYGLMVYLPAYCVPAERGARPPRWRHYILTFLLPIPFTIPVAAIVNYLHPIKIHFPT